eukprot:COSAG04_NODE_1883_length_5310_cov_658.662637_7_plen_44_part_00
MDRESIAVLPPALSVWPNLPSSSARNTREFTGFSNTAAPEPFT